MKALIWILVAIVFFVLGWFAQKHHEELPFLDFLNPQQQEETMTPPAEEEMTMCAQVITPAINPETKAIREFPTPCDVPEGWEVIQNDIPGMDMDLQPI
jgi:hypothetical protein